MKLALHFAWRYLVGKKSTQAINIISGIAVSGVAVATGAMIIVLSVFNGFESLIAGMINRFNPDVKVVPATGKYFAPDSSLIVQLKAISGVSTISYSIEETALFEYDGVQDFGVIKGVDDQYASVTQIDGAITEGRFILADSVTSYAVLGSGIRSKLGVSVRDLVTPIFVYLPNREQRGPLDKPFTRRSLYPGGVFQLEQEFDYSYILASLDFVQRMLAMPGNVGAMEIKLQDGYNDKQTSKKISELVGPDLLVLDRYAQQEDFLKLMNMEKLVSFAILSFILIIVSFNLIGSLWMIALEKQQDISVFKAMGAEDRLIGRIFRIEGLLLVGIGLATGMVLGLAFYWLQVNFGILTIPEGFLVQSYPIELKWTDFLWVTLVVLIIGLGSSYFPVRRAMNTPSIIREE